MKRMLITGASSGIGRATALAAAYRGWHVTACGRNEERLRALAEQHAGALATIEPLAFDVTDADACGFALADRRFDAVLLNAGTCEYVDVDSWDADMFRRVFDTNFFGAVNCLQILLPNLRRGDQLVLSTVWRGCYPLPAARPTAPARRRCFTWRKPWMWT